MKGMNFIFKLFLLFILFVNVLASAQSMLAYNAIYLNVNGVAMGLTILKKY